MFIRASLEAGGVEATSTKEKTRMDLHANAKLGPKGRLVICRRVIEQGWSLTEAAEAAGVSERTAGKWVRGHEARKVTVKLGPSPRPQRHPC